MPKPRLSALAGEVRTILDDHGPVRLPPLAPPATEAELAAAEDAFGFPLPTELRDLYSIARRGYIGALEVTSIERLHADTVKVLGVYEDITFDPSPPEHWEGELPQGDLLAFAGDGWGNVIFYEVNGPLEGRIVLYDFDADGMGTWGRMARSLADCFAWQVTAAQLGGFEVRVFGDSPTLVRLWIAHDEERFLRFLDHVRPAIQAAGGTPAFFGTYDPPPGYVSPAR